MQKAISKYWPVFVLPTLLAFIIGFIWPFIWGIYLSFQRFTTVSKTTFVGIPITIARTGLVDQIITCHGIRLGIKPHSVLVDADGNVPVRRRSRRDLALGEIIVVHTVAVDIDGLFQSGYVNAAPRQGFHQ